MYATKPKINSNLLINFDEQQSFNQSKTEQISQISLANNQSQINFQQPIIIKNQQNNQLSHGKNIPSTSNDCLISLIPRFIEQRKQISNMNSLKQYLDNQQKKSRNQRNSIEKSIEGSKNRLIEENDLTSINSKRSKRSISEKMKTNKSGKNNYQDYDEKNMYDDNQYSPEKLRKKVLNQQGQIIKSICLNNNKQRINLSLLNPSPEVKKQCDTKISQILSNIQFQSNIGPGSLLTYIKQFISSPLPSLLLNPSSSLSLSFSQYLFQIHFYKHTFNFHLHYQFFIRDRQGNMKLLMKAQKNTFSIKSNYFIIYYVNSQQPQNQKYYEFIGKLKHNVTKNEYNLYDIDQKNHKDKERNILMTCIYDNDVVNSQRRFKMYVPKEEYLKDKFLKSENNKNLVSFVQNQNDNFQDSKIKIFQSLQSRKKNLPQFQQNQHCLNDQFDLKPCSNRKVLMKQQKTSSNKQKKPRLNQFQQPSLADMIYMGKIQDNRYLILSSYGLTPLQIFMFSIVNLQH